MENQKRCSNPIKNEMSDRFWLGEQIHPVVFPVISFKELRKILFIKYFAIPGIYIEIKFLFKIWNKS